MASLPGFPPGYAGCAVNAAGTRLYLKQANDNALYTMDLTAGSPAFSTLVADTGSREIGVCVSPATGQVLSVPALPTLFVAVLLTVADLFVLSNQVILPTFAGKTVLRYSSAGAFIDEITLSGSRYPFLCAFSSDGSAAFVTDVSRRKSVTMSCC